jgi:hypothetical protein
VVDLQVASFGAFLLNKEVLTISVAPRDSHKAQIQFALERGLPAFVGMLATQRLPLPSSSFDLIHCSRCLVPFTAFSMSSILTSLFCTWGAGGFSVLSENSFVHHNHLLSTCGFTLLEFVAISLELD